MMNYNIVGSHEIQEEAKGEIRLKKGSESKTL